MQYENLHFLKIHKKPKRRDEYLNKLGIQVLQFDNEQDQQLDFYLC